MDNHITGKVILQFERYLRVSKPHADEKIDILLLSIGDKGAGYYNEVTWPILTADQIKAGINEYNRAVDFLRHKFSGDIRTFLASAFDSTLQNSNHPNASMIM